MDLILVRAAKYNLTVPIVFLYSMSALVGAMGPLGAPGAVFR